MDWSLSRPKDGNKFEDLRGAELGRMNRSLCTSLAHSCPTQLSFRVKIFGSSSTNFRFDLRDFKVAREPLSVMNSSVEPSFADEVKTFHSVPIGDRLKEFRLARQEAQLWRVFVTFCPRCGFVQGPWQHIMANQAMYYPKEIYALTRDEAEKALFIPATSSSYSSSSLSSFSPVSSSSTSSSSSSCSLAGQPETPKLLIQNLKKRNKRIYSIFSRVFGNGTGEKRPKSSKRASNLSSSSSPSSSSSSSPSSSSSSSCSPSNLSSSPPPKRRIQQRK